MRVIKTGRGVVLIRSDLDKVFFCSGGLQPHPWCYTDSEHFRREPCNLDKCGLFGYGEVKDYLQLSAVLF